MPQLGNALPMSLSPFHPLSELASCRETRSTANAEPACRGCARRACESPTRTTPRTTARRLPRANGAVVVRRPAHRSRQQRTPGSLTWGFTWSG